MGIDKKSLNGYKTIKGYVGGKLERFRNAEKSFGTLFSLMFSDEDNVMFEWSEGYRIATMTYGECRSAAIRKANGLRPLLGDEPAVAIYMTKNRPEFIVSLWAILLCGKAPLLLNARLDESVLLQAAATCGAKTVVCSDKAPTGIRTLFYDEIPFGEERFDGKTGEEILLMSSGTSNRVKICAYTAEEIFLQVEDSGAIVRENKEITEGYDGALKLLAMLPFYHIFGFVAVYVWFGFFSRTFVLLDDYSPRTVLNTIRRHEVTHVFSVPLFWQKVKEGVEKTVRERGEKTAEKFQKALAFSKAHDGIVGDVFRKLAFREVRKELFGESIRFMVSGGSGIAPDTLAFFNAIGYHLCNGYGMTETGITSVELSSKPSVLATGSIGKPLSSVAYKIEDGELFVGGGTRAKYVLEGENKTERREWFATKDLAEEKDGRYFILGRKDDLVVSPTGENLNPNLIEPKFDGVGATGACLIGEGESRTPVLILSVKEYLPKARLAATDEEVKKILRETGLSSLIGKVFYTTSPLLVGEEIKLNRARIKEAYERGSLPQADVYGERESDSDPLAERVRAYFAAALNKPAEQVGTDTDFFVDEGGTSLDYFAMMEEMKGEFGVTFPTGEETLTTVRGVKEYLEGKL